MSDEDLKKLVESNAKAIQALTNVVNEGQKDKSQMYQYLARIASAQSNFYELQKDYYTQLADFKEQLAKFQQQLNNQQEQIIKILDRLSLQA